jgi:hypothetical protein
MRSVTDISVPQNEFICSFPVSEMNTDYILLYSFFWVIPWHLNFACRHLGTLCPIFIGGVSRKNLLTPPMKMEQTECSEMSAYKIQTLGNYPKERMKHSEHSGSLKSRLHLNCTGLKYACGIWYYVQATFNENWVFVTTHEEALDS